MEPDVLETSGFAEARGGRVEDPALLSGAWAVGASRVALDVFAVVERVLEFNGGVAFGLVVEVR
jgi:hypothetical protein